MLCVVRLQTNETPQTFMQIKLDRIEANGSISAAATTMAQEVQGTAYSTRYNGIQRK